MKRVFSIILALVMIFSLSITAFAEDGGNEPVTGTGTLTIANSGVGKEYKVYKIFNARYREGIYNENGSLAVDYSVNGTDDPVYQALFHTDGTPVTSNTYFTYTPGTNAVAVVEGSNPDHVINYLIDLVKNNTSIIPYKTVTGTGEEIEIQKVPYGYYLMLSGTNALVTIDSNTPNAILMDKNQQPSGLDKSVKIGDGAYGDKVTANIGDEVTYKIAFHATNYNGSHHIQYYQVHDEKGSAIWANYHSLKVTITEQTQDGPRTRELTKGYYLDMTTDDSEMPAGTTKLSNWDGNIDDAEWYLVHLTNDTFRITIPWVEDHYIDGSVGGYTIKFNGNGASKYTSDVDVAITYDAAVEAEAQVGPGAANLSNKARLTWTCGQDSHGIDFDTVNVETYGFGLLKEDGTNGNNLADAKFRLYKADGTTPVYVVPSNIDGVYVIDNAPNAAEAGKADYTNMQTSRTAVDAGRLAAYLNEKSQDNLVISQANGKLVVRGLDAGTYILKEVEAPPSYNALTDNITVNVSADSVAIFKVFADSTGKVADIQQATGEFKENTYRVTEVEVTNNKGFEMPSTGGEGATMLITIGTIIAMAFAVLMITQKKMSIYKD